MELKRKRMLRRRVEGQGDDEGRGGAEEEAAADMAVQEDGGKVSSPEADQTKINVQGMYTYT